MHLGVDAGNSKTAALLCCSDGRVIGTGRSGPGDIYGVAQTADAVTAVLAAIRYATAAAGVTPHAIQTAAFRLAGIDWPEDTAFWRQVLARELPQLKYLSILNDGFAAIRCGEPSGIGVAIVVGTGPAVAGRGPEGREWSLSWWAQEPLGAHGIGHEALRAACQHKLGIGPATTLTDALPGVYHLDSVDAVLHSFTRRDNRRRWQDKGRAARTVLAAAEAGDPVASGIITRQAQRLAVYARAATTQAGFDAEHDKVPVVLAGSVVTADHSPMEDALRHELACQVPQSRPVVPDLPPVAGATLDAIADAGVAITDDLLATMTRTLPSGTGLSPSDLTE
jgi:N-acetylglucosamine kinase-like BadF-type ATPase